MVIEPNERHLYDYPCEYLEIPKEFVGSWTQLAQTRKFIHKHAGAIKYCVADDDIVIARRNAKYWTGISNMDKSKRVATSDEILDMYKEADLWLDENDIGIVGPSYYSLPPSSKVYENTKEVYGYVFCDGRMLSEIIDDIDITTLRVCEDLIFLFECLSRGINTRRSSEWLRINKSEFKNFSSPRDIWDGMYDKKEDVPESVYHSDEHFEAIKYIQSKYPNIITRHEKNGKIYTKKNWKGVYKPRVENSLEDFI